MKVIETKNFFKKAYTDYNTMPNFDPKGIKGFPRIMIDDSAPLTEEAIKNIWKKRKTRGVTQKPVYQKGITVPSVDETQTVPKPSI